MEQRKILKEDMKLNEIMPQPNLIVYMKNYVMVTINTKKYGVIAIISDISGTEEYPETLKYQWSDINLYEFIQRKMRFHKGSTIRRVVSYNSDDYVIFDMDKEVVRVTKEDIAKKFGTTPEYLEII